jgi:Carboxylesterase family
MSGSSLSQYSHDDNATTSTEEIAKAHNCPSKNDVELVNCMRSMTKAIFLSFYFLIEIKIYLSKIS